ncbi:hypothetical protein SBV1_270085 [Verrucomicrobia bacterium]|nr:hypothetical protein SBV1_270085 [Verrucomicrobiota bacterium]
MGVFVALAARLQAAFAPWAPNTDPTDVPKTHVVDVSISPFTYEITMGGMIDGRMCTTLPGVWEPYEQTWESCRSLRLENVGPANVINPWLKIGPIDFFSQETMASSVVAGLSSDREKALALYYFYITHRYHKGNGDNGSQGDLSQAINVFGFNTCGNSTLCLSDLGRKVEHTPSPGPCLPRLSPRGGKSDGTDVVFQWTPAAAADSYAISDYHFQLSDRPDMRWPMSPNFDKYISRTSDHGQSRYVLPRPGLLTHGVTYYWHVKAKNSKGVWGPWSDTWSFTAQGPAYPIDLGLKQDPATGIGILTWSPNPVGRAPARYRVYGSDEKGFTIHDAPYEVKLGDTKELANPFPANFVAEVAGTSLDVLGVGNLLPNANQAYYRVVAMDALGKRSGDSDYVEAPRPFIYSMPVTSAAAGRPYRYQVQAIRSLGDLARRDGARPKPGTKFWKIEPLKFSLTQKPDWMRIDPDTGLITGTPDGTGGPVTVSVTLTKEHRLVHDENAIVWGNEYEKEKTYEVVGPVIQQFVVK